MRGVVSHDTSHSPFTQPAMSTLSFICLNIVGICCQFAILFPYGWDPGVLRGSCQDPGEDRSCSAAQDCPGK